MSECAVAPYPVPAASVPRETHSSGGRSGTGGCPGFPRFPFHLVTPAPQGGASYLGSAAIRVSKVREGHGGCAWLSLFFSLFLPQPPRWSCASSWVLPQFLTGLRGPSVGSSARSALLEAEPRADGPPSPALQKALHRLPRSGRQKGPWMSRGRERMRVPKGARWRGKVRRGKVRRGAARACAGGGGWGGGVQGGQRLHVTSR